MRSLLALTLCAFLAAVNIAQALRLHGEPLPGITNADVKVTNTKLFRKPQSRIVGGEVASDGFAPWQASLQNQYGNHFCGAVLIADKYALTAASCVAGLQKRNVKVVTSTNDWMGEAWQYEVEDIIVHCNFDKPLYHNDIALLKLATSLAYDDKTQNITVAQLDELQPGEKLTMTGWGSWELGEAYPEELKKLDVTVLSNEECKRIYGKYSEDVDDGHVCVQSESAAGACHGDTGGPLVDSRGVLVGIGNWGVPCAHGFPDVFARVAFYNDWIRTNIKGCSTPP